MDDIVEEFLVLWHGTGGEEPASWLGDAAHFAYGKGYVFCVIDGKAARNKIKGFLFERKFFIEIKGDKFNSRAAALVFSACLFEQVFRDVSAGDGSLSVQSVVIRKTLFA